MDAGTYFEIAKNDRFYNYTLRFDSGMTFATAAASTDLEGNTLDIQGKTYTITEAGVDGTGILNKVKLVAGDSTVWLVQDQPYTVGKHTVTVVDVDTDSTKCGINVDGVTKWVDVSTTEDFGDLSVGVLEAVAVNNKDYNADTCEVTLGSNELTLEEGDKVSVNGVEVEGTTVDFLSSTAGSFTGFTVRYQAGKEETGINSDDLFMKPGDAWSDPVFGNFKVLYEGTTADFESMKFKSSGDDATFTFLNKDGKTVEIPFYYNTTATQIELGTDVTEPMLLPGMSFSGDVEGVQLLYTTSGGETHVLEISDVTCSSSTNKTTIKDVTYGNDVAKDKELAADCGAAEDISLGSLGTINLNLAANLVTYTYNTGKGAGTPESKYEGTFDIKGFGENSTGGSPSNTSGLDAHVQFTEKAGDEQQGGVGSVLKFNLTYDGTDEEITVDTVRDDGAAMTWVDAKEGDSDTQFAVSAKGSMLKFDNDEKLWLEISAPEEDVFANVFVTPLSGKVSGGSSTGGVTADKVNPFTVGLAVLDESAAGMTKNMIVVGGPAVNTIAAELLGNPANPAEGFSAGKAKIKFFDRKGKAALLVAGYDAQDTVGAAYVLASHSKYTLSGDEVEVVVTSLDQITVNKV
jgi:hypothetical protein